MSVVSSTCKYLYVGNTPICMHEMVQDVIARAKMRAATRMEVERTKTKLQLKGDVKVQHICYMHVYVYVYIHVCILYILYFMYVFLSENIIYVGISYVTYIDELFRYTSQVPQTFICSCLNKYK